MAGTTAPAFMRDLVDRAAAHLQAHFPASVVCFQWWADGEYHPYIAKLEWAFGLDAPQVIVVDGRSADFVCQSLPGRLREVDPVTWCMDAAPDEVARYEAEHQRGSLAGRLPDAPARYQSAAALAEFVPTESAAVGLPTLRAAHAEVALSKLVESVANLIAAKERFATAHVEVTREMKQPGRVMYAQMHHSVQRACSHSLFVSAREAIDVLRQMVDPRVPQWAKEHIAAAVSPLAGQGSAPGVEGAP